MRLVVLAVGTRMPRWVDEALADYCGRMPRHMPLALTEIRPEPRTSGKPPAALMEAEAERLRAAIPQGAYRVALDERGSELSSAALAAWLEKRSADGRDLAFLIGGPDGLAAALVSQCEQRLRLSAFTLPHALARVLLAEQLYRAVSILRNHPYHRE
jgi:23S rRNA (pseudouridine1915-N3)-methyltransferase